MDGFTNTAISAASYPGNTSTDNIDVPPLPGKLGKLIDEYSKTLDRDTRATIYSVTGKGITRDLILSAAPIDVFNRFVLHRYHLAALVKHAAQSSASLSAQKIAKTSEVSALGSEYFFNESSNESRGKNCLDALLEFHQNPTDDSLVKAEAAYRTHCGHQVAEICDSVLGERDGKLASILTLTNPGMKDPDKYLKDLAQKQNSEYFKHSTLTSTEIAQSYRDDWLRDNSANLLMASFEAVKYLQDAVDVPRETREALKGYYNSDDASRMRFALEAISTSAPVGLRGPFFNLGPTGRSELRTAIRNQAESRPTAEMEAFADRHVALWKSGAAAGSASRWRA